MDYLSMIRPRTEPRCRICGGSHEAHEHELDGRRYVRAPRDERCAGCRDLEQRGVAVLRCGTCDRPAPDDHEDRS